MILKYRQGEVWSYIDNVRQCASKLLSPDELIMQYNNEVESGDRPDIASYTDFGSDEDVTRKLPADIAMTNKVFLLAVESIDEAQGDRHCENILDLGKINGGYPAYIIFMKVDEHRGYDEIVMVVNDTVYLMNDKGQTIERLA